MKTFILCIIILFSCRSLTGIAQLIPANQKVKTYTWKKSRFENVSADSVTKASSPLLAEWKYGARWALFNTLGTVAVIGGLFAFSDTNEGAAYAAIPVALISLCILPVLVSHGVNKIGQSYFPDGKGWMAFIGGLAGTGALLGMEAMVFRGSVDFLWVFPVYALGAFAIIPLASALTYNLFNHTHKGNNSSALLNFQKGSFEIGSPVPLIYPNPLMQGKISSQISLLKITF